MLTADDVITEVRAAGERVAQQMVQGHRDNAHVQFCRGALGFAEAVIGWYDAKLKEESEGTPAKPNGVLVDTPPAPDAD